VVSQFTVAHKGIKIAMTYTLTNLDVDSKHRYALLIKKIRSFLSQNEIVEVVTKINRKVVIHQSTVSSWEKGTVNFVSQSDAITAIALLFGYSTLDDFGEMLGSDGYNSLVVKNTFHYWGVKAKSYLLRENELIELMDQLSSFDPDMLLDVTTKVIGLREIATSRFSKFLRHLRGTFSQLAFSDWINSVYVFNEIEITQEWVSARENGRKTSNPLPAHVLKMLCSLTGVIYEEFLAYLDGNESPCITNFYNRSLLCNQLILLGKSLPADEREDIQLHLAQLIKDGQDNALTLNPLQQLISEYLKATSQSWDDLFPSVEPYGLSMKDIKQICRGELISPEKLDRLWAAIASPNGTTYFKRDFWNEAVTKTAWDIENSGWELDTPNPNNKKA
jgi:hypothetical protein